MSKSIGVESYTLTSMLQGSCQSYVKYSAWRRMKVGDEWIRYQEMNVTEDDQILSVDHLWKNCSQRKITMEISLKPKMVKCALALFQSSADFERSLSDNKRMLTKQNVSMKDETIVGLRASKVAVQDYGGVQNVPMTP